MIFSEVGLQLISRDLKELRINKMYITTTAAAAITTTTATTITTTQPPVVLTRGRPKCNLSEKYPKTVTSRLALQRSRCYDKERR